MSTATTLVAGASAHAREAVILDAVDPALATVVILEGLPSGDTALDDLASRHPSLSILRIAPGCICCNGNLTMRVTLNRALRQRPARLFIGLANALHLDQIRQFLVQEPYDKYLSLTKEIALDSRSS